LGPILLSSKEKTGIKIAPFIYYSFLNSCVGYTICPWAVVAPI